MENRFNDESEVKEALQGLLPSMVEKSFNDAKTCHKEWVKYVTLNHVVPLFEKFQELELWQEKGLGLKGAAIKFKCPDDSIFSKCQPVEYTKVPATTVRALSYVEQMVGDIPEVEFNPQKILLTQNYDHRKNKEWRLISDSEEASLVFPPDLIQSVYLGALVSSSNAEKLKNHLAKVNPSVNVYHAHCKTNEFGLDFKKINEEIDEAEELVD